MFLNGLANLLKSYRELERRSARNGKQQECTALEPKSEATGSHSNGKPREATALEPKSRRKIPILKNKAWTSKSKLSYGEIPIEP